MKPTFNFNLGDDGHTVPARFAICSRCEGAGRHDHPAFSNGITSDEWNGPDWDDESREAYLRGDYDVRCEECSGSGKVLVPDVSACTYAQKRLLVLFRREQREIAADREADRRTYLMESGHAPF